MIGARSVLPIGFPCTRSAGVFDRLLIGRLGDGHALQPDKQPCVIHHGEHVFKAAVRLTDEIGDRPLLVAVGHDGRGRTMDAELVFDGGTDKIVARPEAAVGIDQKLRRHEQRNPARPRRRVRQSRKHEMDDVLGDIVFAPGNEYLGSEQAIVVAVRLRPRAYGGEV